MFDFLNKYLILETVEQQLTDAINNNQAVTMYYKGNKEGVLQDQTKVGVRHVLPVALGLSKNGNMIVRGYLQSKGIETPWRNHTSRWKTYRVDRITSIFAREGKRDFWSQPPAGFNPNGDKSMIQVYALADFNNKSSINPTNPKIEPEKVEPETPEPRKPDGEYAKLFKPESEAPEPREPENIEPTAPKPMEPEENDENEEQPISEWYLWLNKVLKN